MNYRVLQGDSESPKTYRIGIVGVGPRGTYALGRLLSPGSRIVSACDVEVLLIEPVFLGGGAIYRLDQPDFLMNTLADQITAFADSSVSNARNEILGPTLGEWMKAQGIPTREGYPRRSDHGRYLHWAIQQMLERCPSQWRIIHVKQRVTDIETVQVGKRVFLDSGDSLHVHHVLLTTGNLSLESRRTITEAFRGQSGTLATRVFPQPYPAETYMDTLEEGESVGIVGLGLSFVDVVLALTVGRGGQFVEGDDGHYTYLASGKEPRLFGWSRSGLPLRGKAKNQKPSDVAHRPKFLTVEMIQNLRATFGQLNFQRHIFPLLELEMEREFANVSRKIAARGVLMKFPSWDDLVKPLGSAEFHDGNEYQAAVLKVLADDVSECEKGNQTSPVKASCEILREVRDVLRSAIEFCGLDASSQNWLDTTFMSDYNSLCVGPPYFRLKELIALVHAGVLNLQLGPNPKLATRQGRIVVSSSALRQQTTVELDALIDARIIPEESELLKNLLQRRLVRRLVNDSDGDRYALPTIEISRNGFVIGADGREDRELGALGPLAEGTLWFTQAAARPWVNSRTMRDAGVWAQAIRNVITHNNHTH